MRQRGAAESGDKNHEVGRAAGPGSVFLYSVFLFELYILIVSSMLLNTERQDFKEEVDFTVGNQIFSILYTTISMRDVMEKNPVRGKN